MGKQWKHWQTLFGGGGGSAPKLLCTVAAAIKLNGPWKEGYEKPREHIKKKNHHFANKGPDSHIMVFPVVMYGCKSRTIMKAEVLMFSNCDAGEDSWGSIGLHSN